jgi:nitrogen fixation NifU-like protein
MVDKNLNHQQLVELGYSSKAIELYVKEVNVGVMENPDADAVFLGTKGDLVRIYIKIDGNGLVEDTKFLCYGCPGSACAMSAMTLLIENKPLSQAKQLTEKEILKALGGLPDSRKDCATLAVKILSKAIAEYERAKRI